MRQHPEPWPSRNGLPDMNNDTKHCHTCGQHLPATTEHFGVNNAKPDGLDIKCKECRSAYKRDRAMAKGAT